MPEDVDDPDELYIDLTTGEIVKGTAEARKRPDDDVGFQWDMTTGPILMRDESNYEPYYPHKHNSHHFATVIFPWTAGLLDVL